MFLTVHATMGVIIGQTTNNPVLAFFFGIISHFILDMIPHGDRFFEKYSGRPRIRLMLAIGSTDAVIMALFLTFILNKDLGFNYLPVAFGIAGSLLPDMFAAMGELTNKKIKIFRVAHQIHHKIHYFALFEKFNPSLKTGIFLQILILIFLTGLIL